MKERKKEREREREVHLELPRMGRLRKKTDKQLSNRKTPCQQRWKAPRRCGRWPLRWGGCLPAGWQGSEIYVLSSEPTLSFLSLFFFWKKAGKTTRKTRIFYPYRTLKIPAKEGKNAQENKEFLARRKNKEFQKNKERKDRARNILKLLPRHPTGKTGDRGDWTEFGNGVGKVLRFLGKPPLPSLEVTRFPEKHLCFYQGVTNGVF